jgi:opacity protein-like surface antigen
MKKLMIMAMLALSINAFSQFGVSLKGGVSVSIPETNSNFKVDNLITFLPELTANYHFMDNFSVNLGVGYSVLGFVNKGINFRQNAEDIGFQIDVKKIYNYITIPVYATYNFPIHKFYIGADAGAKLNLFLNEKMKDNNGDIYTIDTNFQTKFVPYLLIAAKVGYRITENISADLSFRYNYSLKNADTDGINSYKFNEIDVLLGVNYSF